MARRLAWGEPATLGIYAEKGAAHARRKDRKKFAPTQRFPAPGVQAWMRFRANRAE
jgi:hypothetical protein